MTKEVKGDRINYADLVERLGADLVTLQRKTRTKNTDADPGKFMVVEIAGTEHRMEPALIQAFDTAIKDALEEAGRNGLCS